MGYTKEDLKIKQRPFFQEFLPLNIEIRLNETQSFTDINPFL